jgi:quaternary ammonium compound-resistance protein SugE
MLVIAGFFEVGFATCLGKARQGEHQAWWMAGFFLCLSVSMLLLYRASLTIPIGTAYAVWTGIGAVGTVLVGVFVFREPATFWRMLFLFTLIGSIVGLKAVSH